MKMTSEVCLWCAKKMLFNIKDSFLAKKYVDEFSDKSSIDVWWLLFTTVLTGRGKGLCMFIYLPIWMGFCGCSSLLLISCSKTKIVLLIFFFFTFRSFFLQLNLIRCLSCLSWYLVCSVIADNGIANHRGWVLLLCPTEIRKREEAAVWDMRLKKYILLYSIFVFFWSKSILKSP